MKKFWTRPPLILACALFVLPITSIIILSWYDGYKESSNDYTTAQACQIKAGMNIDAALIMLRNPSEYHTYNFSNVYSSQYRNIKKGYFLEITYAQNDGTIEEIWWGRGRTKSLTKSGVCN